jgi:hypothetical protein
MIDLTPTQIQIVVDRDGKITTRTQGCNVAPPPPMDASEFTEEKIKAIIAYFVEAVVPK